MARTTSKQTESKAAPKAEAVEAADLFAALIEELKAQGVTVKPKWAPSKSYASLLVQGKNIGYVFRQTKRGMRIEPALSKSELPKGAKGWKPGTRSETFALVGNVATEAEAKAAAAVLVAADEKRKAPKAEPSK
jgi:hypothetical protein